MSRPVLEIVIGSTRPGRVGLPVAEWVYGRAVAHGGFDAELVDLAQVALPLFDEPQHPMLHTYVHEHTRQWSATVDRADAFVFVMPEYNYGFNAALKNAIDYLHVEWQYKPVGFVSYGGVAGGARAVQMLRQVVGPLKMVDLFEAVYIPFVAKLLDEARTTLHADEGMEVAADLMFNELGRWATALQPLRPPR
jgi:NAD(P)H-dependent FMN reductase